jgi:hypothetical protein
MPDGEVAGIECSPHARGCFINIYANGRAWPPDRYLIGKRTDPEKLIS